MFLLHGNSWKLMKDVHREMWTIGGAKHYKDVYCFGNSTVLLAKSPSLIFSHGNVTRTVSMCPSVMQGGLPLLSNLSSELSGSLEADKVTPQVYRLWSTSWTNKNLNLVRPPSSLLFFRSLSVWKPKRQHLILALEHQLDLQKIQLSQTTSTPLLMKEMGLCSGAPVGTLTMEHQLD